MGQNVRVVLLMVSGLAAGAIGVAWGRLVPKVDPIGMPCPGCDGWAGLPAALVPWRAPVRCSDCRRTVRWPTAGLELAAGGVLAALAVLGEGGWVLAARGWLLVVLAALVWADARYRVLPGGIVWAGGIGSAVLCAVADVGALDRALAVAATAGGLALVLHLAAPDGLGFGDVRLCALLGLHLGWGGSGEAAAWALVLASAAGAGWGLLRPGGDRRATVPFGPFLAGAAAVVLVAVAAGT